MLVICLVSNIFIVLSSIGSYYSINSHKPIIIKWFETNQLNHTIKLFVEISDTDNTSAELSVLLFFRLDNFKGQNLSDKMYFNSTLSTISLIGMKQ